MSRLFSVRIGGGQEWWAWRYLAVSVWAFISFVRGIYTEHKAVLTCWKYFVTVMRLTPRYIYLGVIDIYVKNPV
jgi:hypothetical protein